MNLDEIRRKFAAKEITKPEFIDQMHEAHGCLFDYAAYIPQTDIEKIEITDGQVMMTSRELGVKIICGKSDKRIAPIEILNFQHYEKKDSDMIFRLVSNGDRILDIGANIGWYSINLAKRFPQCKILAFEPIPKTFSQLEKNISINSVSNIETYNHGFSNETKDLIFYYYPTGSENASSAKLADVEGVQEIKCRVKTLDDFMSSDNASVDFIKCDVEGAELFVFQGGVETLKKCKPIIFTEMLRKWSAKFNYHPNEIIKLLGDIGYKCFSVNDTRLVEFFSMDEDTVETNFFFLHTEKHAAQIRMAA